MKTEDWIQLGALAVVGYLAYQKYGVKAPAGSSTPAAPALPSTDFGIGNANDDTWGMSGLGMSVECPPPPPCPAQDRGNFTSLIVESIL